MKTTHTHSVGACPACGYGNGTPDGRLTVPCAGCGVKITLKRVVGVYTDKRDCDPTCLYAVGEICACNCGGANHGLGYSPGTKVGEVPEFVITRNRKRHENVTLARASRANAKIIALRTQVETLINAHPHVTFLVSEAFDVPLGYRMSDVSMANSFHSSLAEQLLRTGVLSERQIDALETSIIRDQEREQRQAEQDAEDAELIKAGVQIPSGKVTIVGEIQMIKPDDGPYGFAWKMTVKSVDGWRVYGTVPAALIDAARAEGAISTRESLRTHLVGRKITMVATINPKDQLFGFTSRPGRAALV